MHGFLVESCIELDINVTYFMELRTTCTFQIVVILLLLSCAHVLLSWVFISIIIAAAVTDTYFLGDG